jgi:PAS domain S-box-containing protein
MTGDRISALRGHGIAILAVAMATALRWSAWSVLGDTLPYLFYFAAVMASGWYGGLRPGLLATALSAIAATAGSISTPGGFDPLATRDILGLTVFLLIGGGMSALCGNLHGAWRRMRVTLRSIGDAVIVTNARGRIVSLNPVAETLTGWSEVEAHGQPLERVFRIVNEQTRHPVENPTERAMREGAIVGLGNHTILIAKDGTETAIDDSAASIRDDEGVAGCVLVFRDVTARRRADRANAVLAAVVSSSDDAIVSKTLDGTIMSWNTGAERLFGYAEEEAIGQPITLIIPEDRQEEEREIIEKLRRGERVDHFETVRRRKDGHEIHVSLTISPILDASGSVVGASKVARDISDRKRVEAERQEADRRKDEFLATLAHELRNPLAPIRNAVQILRLAAAEPGQHGVALGIMDRQLEQMVRLIDDLLDVSRISRGALELRREPIELDAAVDRAIETSRPLIDDARQELVVRLLDEPVHLHADLARLSQVFANLLNNASKYTPEGGRIGLTAEREGDAVVVTVTDSGRGIPEDKLASIFDLFTQLDSSLDRPHGGLGVGLSLARRIVEMHGGWIEARSGGEGRGSQFAVTLPTTAPPATIAALPSVARHRPSGRRILIVDDNRDAAESLALLLGVGGNEIHVAHDGEEALEAAERLRPDVILLDIGLPKLNGYEVCRRIRQHPWGRAIAIIALTGWGQAEDRRRSDEAGFDAHLVKPVKYDDVMALLA